MTEDERGRKAAPPSGGSGKGRRNDREDDATEKPHGDRRRPMRKDGPPDFIEKATDPDDNGREDY